MCGYRWQGNFGHGRQSTIPKPDSINVLYTPLSTPTPSSPSKAWILHPVPAFNDNYVWVLHDGKQALAVDPGETVGLEQYLSDHHLSLRAILVTHHHGDHTGGVRALAQAHGAQVFGPARERIPEPYEQLEGGQTIECLGLRFSVIDVPGHTAGHIAYCCEEALDEPVLFCGDTLFSGGCGRLFEGTASQMLTSLKALAALPPKTHVCPAHEYTLSNLKFAVAVEPSNADLLAYRADCEALRSIGRPTLPSSIAVELQINPFLRANISSVVQGVRTHAPDTASDELSVWTALREWKNVF